MATYRLKLKDKIYVLKDAKKKADRISGVREDNGKSVDWKINPNAVLEYKEQSTGKWKKVEKKKKTKKK